MRFRLIWLLIFVAIYIPNIQAQDKSLQVIGTVVGRERLYGPLYGESPVVKRILIVRIDENILVNPDAKYILVDYRWRLTDKGTPYDGDDATRWNFNLMRESGCDSTLESLQFNYLSSGKEVTGLFPRLDRALGREFENLPFAKALPCYQLDSGNFSPVKLPAPGPAKISQPAINSAFKTDMQVFVLSRSLIANLSQTPVEIAVLDHGLFNFTNNSKKKITSYTLGCVAEKENKTIIISTLNSEDADLAPNDSITTPEGSGGGIVYSEQLKTCYDKKSRFSVIKVIFEDKSIWQAR